MAVKKLKVEIVGVSPLLMHSPQVMEIGHPIGAAMKKITSKRGKTEEDLLELMRLEWLGGLYVNDREKVIVPGAMLEACLVAGAKKVRLGKQFLSGVFVDEDPELDFPGKKYKLDVLYKDRNYRLTVPVRVQQARVMRTRPMFKKWSLKFAINFNDEVVNKKDVQDALATAGQLCAIGDWRPKFGRFEVQKSS